MAKPKVNAKTGGPTRLDAGRFRAAYSELVEDEDGYDGEVPETLEKLFDGLHDPDDFSPETAATLRAALASVERRATVLANDPLLANVTVYPGDLRVDASFTFDSHVLVLGELDVEGVVTASPAHAILMVAGNVRCRAMQLVRGYLFATGDVIVRDCFFGTAYGLSKVAGRIKAPIYLQDGSWSNLALDDEDEPTLKNVTAKLKLDVDAPEARAKLSKVLAPGALGEDKPDFGAGYDDLFALFDKIEAGETVLRNRALDG